MAFTVNWLSLDWALLKVMAKGGWAVVAFSDYCNCWDYYWSKDDYLRSEADFWEDVAMIGLLERFALFRWYSWSTFRLIFCEVRVPRLVKGFRLFGIVFLFWVSWLEGFCANCLKLSARVSTVEFFFEFWPDLRGNGWSSSWIIMKWLSICLSSVCMTTPYCWLTFATELSKSLQRFIPTF